MIDKDQIIKAQQEKIERIEQLQEELHKLSMFGLLTVNILGLFDELEDSLKTVHQVSHVIKDVLDGMSPREAIEKNMTENDEEEE
ncbi:hypothetical protein PNO25_02455 [Streptococcus oralis]|nr:hypothetical protein [Streptococcus oralis]MDB6218404.1 hypothetical protein [Streptococcus oralis]